jgi:hypothetical protein
MKTVRFFIVFLLTVFFGTDVLALVSEQDSMSSCLSGNAEISLLTSSPSDEAVYMLYGHTSIRVRDKMKNLDLVFNYGLFDSSKPNFVYRFAKGECDYRLGAYPYAYFISEYKERGQEVTEQVLNLLPEEKETLWQALVTNALPENSVYRYNFFFDNCATRPAALIEKSLNCTIKFAEQKKVTFRDVINDLTRYEPWVTLGCDLVVGLPADRVMTVEESFFIPDYLKNAFARAEIVRADTLQPLVEKTNILNPLTAVPVEKDFSLWSSPLTCFLLLLLLVVLLTYLEWSSGRYFRMIDCVLFFAAGLAGCIIFFLSFISVHPAMFPNMSLMWLHPFHLVAAVLFLSKKFNIITYWYHFINFALVFVMLIAWIFMPQHFNVAFIPLIAILLVRSGWALLRKK